MFLLALHTLLTILTDGRNHPNLWILLHEERTPGSLPCSPGFKTHHLEMQGN